MPIHLFSPSCPHADPTAAGIDQSAFMACGGCVCVPRYWKVECKTPDGANDLAKAVFGPTFVMNRELSNFRASSDALCQWTCSFPVTSPPGDATWTLYHGAISAPDGSGAAVGWILVAGGPTPFPLNEVAAYAFLGPMFNCMGKNTLTFLPSPTSDGFNVTPDTVTITPFYP